MFYWKYNNKVEEEKVDQWSLRFQMPELKSVFYASKHSPNTSKLPVWKEVIIMVWGNVGKAGSGAYWLIGPWTR